MEKVSIVEVTTKRQLREFIYLPAKIHKDHLNWLPPIYVDEFKFFNPKKNHAFSHCDTVLYLAFQGKDVVGRIMGIIHHQYNEVRGERTGRFGFLECHNDELVAGTLLAAVENWVLARGVEKLIGPYGFSDKDPQGLQISGFEHMPILATAVNLPYMVELVEKNGYTKDIDCLVYMLDLHKPLPEVYNRILQRFENRKDFVFKEFKAKKEFKHLVIPILRLVNETYCELYGFTPLTELEMKEFASRYMDVLDPRFVKVITKNDDVVAFIVGLPNFTPGVQKSKGKLLPFGLFHILKAMKATRQLDLMLGAVKPNCQGLGFEILMGMKLIDSCKAAGYEKMEIHLVLETNHKMLAELERVDAQLHKKFRVYGKELNGG
jgi:hypothetical protein